MCQGVSHCGLPGRPLSDRIVATKPLARPACATWGRRSSEEGYSLTFTSNIAGQYFPVRKRRWLALS
jgi:hypothetical protein